MVQHITVGDSVGLEEMCVHMVWCVCIWWLGVCISMQIVCMHREVVCMHMGVYACVCMHMGVCACM